MPEPNPFEKAPAATTVVEAPAPTPAPAVEAPAPAVTPAPAAEKPVASEIPAAEKPAATPSAEEDTLLGSEPKPAEEIARLAKEAEEKAKAEAKAKEEKLKNETPEEKAAREKAEADAAKVVPEKYSVKAPEGMKVDEAFLTEKLTPVLKKHNVTQGALQEIIDVYAPHLQSQLKEGILKQQTDAIDGFKKMVKEWGEETKAWLGPKPDEARAPAAKAINKLSSDPKALRAFLNDTGVGNNKLLMEVFIRAGKLLAEDSFPTGRAAPGTEDHSDEAKAERMFGPKVKASP